MRTVHSFREVRHLTEGIVGLVPTMGYFHEGHLNLIDAAAHRSDTVVVSLFVNPLQFGDETDLESYPADLSRDRQLAQKAGADVLFAPSVDEMYDPRHGVTVTVGGVGDAMEGTHRPGHFEGVATAVAKLFGGIQPDLAFFGRKDAQQLAVVSTMVAGLSMNVEIVGCSTVREPDGLALSSRNTRLSTSDRSEAAMLSAALFAAGDRFIRGERRAAALTATVRKHLAGLAAIELEYTEVADAVSAQVVEDVAETSFIALAATVGGVRLIDNIFIDPHGAVADKGVRLRTPSILYGGNACC